MPRARTTCVLLLALAILASGCQEARAGASCRGDAWGQQGDWVLRCERGRWVRKATKAQVVSLLQAVAEAKRRSEGQVVRPGDLGPVVVQNAADPDVLVAGGVHYVFSTRNFRNVPVRVVRDVDRPIGEAYASTVDAMPARIPWASRQEVWAPTARRIGSRYVMFFSAPRRNPPDRANEQCIGRAFASAPAGPYVPDPAPFNCGFDGVHGALDPSLYVAPDGSITLLAAFGGSTMNLRAIRLDVNANATSGPIDLLARTQGWEQWFLENPSMTFDGRDYLLAYSAGRWQEASYVTGVARCASPLGPCNSSAAGPWLTSVAGRSGPGGLSFFTGADGQARVVFHSYPAGNTCNTCRSAHVRRVAFDPWPRLL